MKHSLSSNTLKFSIVMPLLNGVTYLEDAVLSVLNQTYENVELIIVDGGSTDGSLNVIERLVEMDQRVSVLSRPGLGIYESILTGLDVADGDILGWLNSDDLYVPWTFSTAAMWMGRNNVDWITGLPSIWDVNGQMRAVFPHVPKPSFAIRAGGCNDLMLGCVQAESTFFSPMLYCNLSEVEKESIMKMKLAGDFHLWKAFAVHSKLYQIPTILGGFRIHSHNASIIHGEVYRAEVKVSGAIMLPRLMAVMLRRILVSLSGFVWHKNAEAETGRLVVEFESADDHPDTKFNS